MREYPSYTYYAGFEHEFKKITKKYGKKTYFASTYEDEIKQFKKDDINNSDNEDSENESDYESESDDDFDNLNDSNKKIKKNNLKLVKEQYIFYYQIVKRMDDTKKKYDLNIVLIDNDLKQWLENEGVEIEKVNNLDCIELDSLFTYTNDFKCKIEKGNFDNPLCKLFVAYLEKVFSKDYNKMNKMIQDKMIDFHSLWFYLDKLNAYYVVKIFDQYVAFKYDSFSYKSSNNESGDKILLNGTIMLYNKEGTLYSRDIDYYISYFSNKKSLDSFDIHLLTEDEKNEFIERSEIVKKYMTKVQQMNLKGKQLVNVNKSTGEIERFERVIVDNINSDLRNLLPDFIDSYSSYEDIEEESEDYKKAITYPFIPIFNLGCGKLWGMTYYDNLSEIVYKENIFDDIVMDKDKKNIIRKLIQNYDYKINNNIIEGKGQNLIFLLHGPPGVGKTLTAEAASELLKKPLYHINIGDLDLNPAKLEINLKEIDKLCNQWNAILLIDEADIFLEARNYCDISRNTIVAIFLKFLEYSKNIIFLTTNRLETLDLAIRSRINLMLTYSKLRDCDRSEIWNKSLSNYKIENKSRLIGELSRNELNGREIGNLLDIIFTILKNEYDLSKEIKYNDFYNLFKKCMDINNESDFSVKSSSMYS